MCPIFQGGLLTTEEMCQGFLYYYPLVNITRCESVPSEHQTLSFLDVTLYYEYVPNLTDTVIKMNYRILPNTRASPNRRAPQIFVSRTST